jgi:PAS domain S-box-containing protein
VTPWAVLVIGLLLTAATASLTSGTVRAALVIAGLVVTLALFGLARGQAGALRDEAASRRASLGRYEHEQRARAEVEVVSARLRAILENTSDGFLLLDSSGRLIEMNPISERLLERPRADLLGRPVWGTPFFALGSMADTELRRAVRDSVIVQFEAPSPDGTRWLEVNAYPTSDGVSVFWRDATDRRHAEETRERLAAIVDSSDDAIVSKDLNGVIQTWNRGAERLFGYTAEEAVGRPITILIPPEAIDEEASILARIRRGHRIEHYETVRVHKDGRRFDISLSISPVRDATGTIVGASKIARDISELKRVAKEREQLLEREQQARTEAEAASRAKDEFLATLSHELRTPLNAIVGWAQVLSSARQDPGLVERALETIMRNAKHQTQLIEDLLDLSSIIGGRLRLNPRPVELVAVLAGALETVRPAADAKQLEIQTSFGSAIGVVTGDSDRLQQVFWNLLSNAVKFTPKGGRVVVRLDRERSRARVTISDTGIGIGPETLPYIFDRFRQGDSSITRAHGGLGLGLAIVRQLVELHGGTVEARSPGEGQGATFTVSLPVTPLRGADTRAAPQPASELPRCDGIRVLLVDDEADARELVAVLLRRCGAVVTEVSSAGEALAVIERADPDVVVSDLAMPSVDGYELIHRIRALPHAGRVPAIALTAHASADARVKAFQAGFDTYVAKPVEAAELVAVVVRLARRAGPAAALGATSG